MAVDEKWYFTKEQLLQSPSRKAGYDVDKELSCRQQAANFIQDMGQRLQVSQLCINTAIVYMHRFYVFHSLAAFHRNAIAAAALFLAAKVEEQPRKLEHVIKVAHMCLHRENPNLDTKSELYLEQAQDLVFNENVLLQTLGFDVAIDHPHTHVVRCCHLVRASKDLAQTSYFMASNSLHLTTMCLQYKPTVVACFCIHLACKWSNWEIPRSNEGKDWFWYIDKTVTIDLLEQLTGEFLAILDKCPTKLKRKMMSMNQNNTPGFTQQSIPHDGLQFEEPRKLTGAEAIKVEGLFTVQKSNSQSAGDKGGTSSSSSSQSHTHHQKIDYREYREKKERERMEREKQQLRDSHNVSSTNHHHHSKANVMSIKSHSNVQSRSSSGSVSHKSYQQPPQGTQQNMHFQNVKESRDSSSQSFQSSSAGKDSNYLKQHPPHMERDGGKDSASFHGQYSQNSNIQHQGYPHKSESNYSGNYSHRDGSRGGHGIQGSGSSNLSQAHHSQNQNLISNSTNSVNSTRESMMGNQRDGAIAKESESQSQQPQMKDNMSSSIRDIINQSVSQKDVHSMTNERKEHVRDKSRMNYMHGSTSGSNFKPDSVKTGRESGGMNFHELSDRKMDDMTSRLKEKPFKKGEEEPVIDTVKIESTTTKLEKFDETDMGDENTSWSFGMNMPNIKTDKSNTPVTVKTESNVGKNEVNIDAIKGDGYSSNSDAAVSNKSQSAHSMKMYDSKYKGHHYHSSSKNSDIPQIKIDKPGAQCLNSDLYKKLSDRAHDKQRKPQELERGSLVIEGSSNLGDMSKHHKLNKEASDKHKIIMPGQHNDQRTKEKLSPSKYQKVKGVPRPSNLPYGKSEPGHYSLDPNSNSNTMDGERVEGGNQHLMSLKPMGAEETTKNVGNVSGFQKQKSHGEFGASGNLTSTLSDGNFVKSSKTSSIFSPDSKIPPQNILNSLEKDSKKNSLSSQRSHTSSKTSPSSILTGSKKTGSAAILGTMTTSTTSTTGSLFSPPLPKNVPSVAPRHRTSSSGSEPELIPVVPKIEEPGYENMIRDKKASLISNDSSPSVDREKKSSGSSESTNAFLFEFDHKTNAKDVKSNDVKTNAVSSESNQSVTSKPLTNVKFPTEIRSDLGAVIYPTNPKSIPVTKSGQGFPTGDSKLSLPKSTSTVNLSGIEKMVDTSISPSKQVNPFIGQVVKSSGVSNSNLNQSVSFVNTFGSSNSSSIMDQPDKSVVDQSSLKAGNAVPNSDVDVDVLAYSEKKRSEKKKKKEKHKHKEKDKDKSERKKEKKKHKDKDKERSKEKDKHKDKEKYKDRERYKEKEIDVVSSETPIKITIPKDKISGGLKIRIPKDYLRKEEPDTLKSNTSGELKIKISKDNCSNSGTYKEELKSESRKRDRSPKSTSDLPHSKSMRTLDKKSSGSLLKANGTEGPSRNSSSQKYSVSENGSYFDISSLYDFPFDFEENGQGIIKTPDYDFEALNASDYPQDFNTSPESKEIEECDKNSHNELELTKDEVSVVTSEPETSAMSPKVPDCCDLAVTCGDITTESIPKPISPLNDIDSPERLRFSEAGVSTPPKSISETPWSLNEDRSDTVKRDKNVVETKYEDVRKDKMISLENCDVLKNYKTILDSHSRRCETEVLKHNVSPVSPEESTTETAITTTTTTTTTSTTTTTTTTTCTVNSNNDDNNNKKSNTSDIVTSTDKSTVKGTNNTCETENPNYYNKYFKKDGGSRTRTRDDKRSVKSRVDDKGSSRFDDRQRYYDNRRYNRTEFNERDRRDDRRYYRDYRDYSKDSSQYYYERNDERRFDYPDYSSNSQYFNGSKVEGTITNLNYEVNTNGPFQSVPPPPQSKTTPQFSQLCDPSIATNPPEMNVQYQYSYFNNYMYAANGAYRFYGNVPFVNMSYVQQQPIPPGTGDSFIQLDAPPLPLEPPPDLPPPPETPPPPPK